MTTEQGQKAPFPHGEFDDAEGQPHDLTRAAENGPLLLGIYKSSCASSKQMFPFLERLSQRHGGDGLTVLGISQDSANITRSFARRYGLTFPLVLEGDDYPVSRAFDIMATPTVFLIEPNGTLDALGDAVADALGKPHQALVTSDDADVPMFVPG
jgi:peroxiredoxin